MKPRLALLFTFLVVLTYGACSWGLRVQKQQDAHNQQLIEALSKHDARAALVLVNEGADPNTRVVRRPTSALKTMLSRLLRPASERYKTSPTAFMIACGDEWFPPKGKAGNAVTIKENLPLIEAMLAHGANVNARGFGDCTALHSAAGRPRTVALLLEHGADIEAKDALEQTPLMMAAYVESASVAHVLLAHGANPNARAVQGDTALHIACSNAPRKLAPHDIIFELMAYGANPNLKNHQGVSPLSSALDMVRLDQVRLLTRGAR